MRGRRRRRKRRRKRRKRRAMSRRKRRRRRLLQILCTGIFIRVVTLLGNDGVQRILRF